MNIHWLQHVEFEGLGTIESWAHERAHTLHATRLFLGEELPRHEDIDMLIVMGGPMGIHDESQYPWLATEKRFIRECVRQRLPVLGICLGAQLLADALSGTVRPNGCKEIGWFPVRRCSELPAPLADFLPEQLEVLHWHGDTFTLPAGAHHLYSSEACAHQAFLCENLFLGVQFHLEIEQPQLVQLIANCKEELTTERWIQAEARLLQGSSNGQERQATLFAILDFLAAPERAGATK